MIQLNAHLIESILKYCPQDVKYVAQTCRALRKSINDNPNLVLYIQYGYDNNTYIKVIKDDNLKAMKFFVASGLQLSGQCYRTTKSIKSTNCIKYLIKNQHVTTSEIIQGSASAGNLDLLKYANEQSSDRREIEYGQVTLNAFHSFSCMLYLFQQLHWPFPLKILVGTYMILCRLHILSYPNDPNDLVGPYKLLVLAMVFLCMFITISYLSVRKFIFV